MAVKSSAKSAKTNKVVARSVGKKFRISLRSPAFLIVVVAVAIFGGYFLYKSFALTNTVTYSGSFTKRKSSVSYSINATADGTLTAVATYSNTSGFKMNLLANDGHSLTAALSGTDPQTMTVPVTKGAYTLMLYGSPTSKGSGSYTVSISYPVADTVPPVAAITSPTSGATIKGLTNIEGTATDNDGVSKVEMSVDGAALTQANLTGTSTTSQTWSYLLDTTKLSNTSHTVTVKVTDLTGNTATASTTYTVNNAVAVPDTTPPSVTITAPGAGSTVSETTTFQGIATDNVGVVKVQYKVDNAASWSVASGTTAWSFNVDTTTLSNNSSHTIYIQALDGAGNVGAASEIVTVSNTMYSTTAPSTQGSWVSPEGITINVNSAGTNPDTGNPWTIADVYGLLTANGKDLTILGSRFTINLQDTYASMTTTSYQVSGGVYSNWSGTSWLKGVNSTFATWPDAVFTHEFGEIWTMYWWSMNHQADWSSYINMRLDGSTYNGVTYQYLGQDPRYNTGQTWDPREIIADDYRLLFGSQRAISQDPNDMINTTIVDPRNQPGLGTWLLNTWR